MNRSNKNETTNNPLAQARRGRLVAGRRRHERTAPNATPSSTVSQSRPSDPAEAHAKELWFRKTGTGLACFIAYYTQVVEQQQHAFGSSSSSSSKRGDGENDASVVNDDNVVVSDPSRCESSGSTTMATTASKVDGAPKRAGQSRAALRRKRRKGTDPTAAPPTATDVAVAEVAKGDEHNHGTDPNNAASHGPVSDHPLWQAMLSAEASVPSTTTAAAVPGQASSLSFRAAMVATLTRPLPSTFRVRRTAHVDDVQRLACQLEAAAAAAAAAAVTEPKHDPVVPRPAATSARWSVPPHFEPCEFLVHRPTPDSCALVRYQSPCPKSLLPIAFKELLLSASQTGLIARQELGSMLPVAALQQAHAFAWGSGGGDGPLPRRTVVVLDMCASPGSKTLQALEVLVSNQTTYTKLTTTSHSTSSKSKFMLVANDVLQSRVDALQQAVERSGMPKTTAGNITYTCQDATKFALCVAVTKPNDSAVSSRNSNGSGTEPLLFDVILCDVPCSGDGTIRKDRHILTRWTPAVAHQLHATQLALLTRALQLLKPGGMVCYSTCSMNPVENEAVVAAAMARFNQAPSSSTNTKIQRSNGNKDVGSTAEKVELVECPNTLGVILRNGLSTWKVAAHNADCTNDDDGSDDDFADHINASSSRDNDTPSGNVKSRNKNRELLSWYATYDDAVANGDGVCAWKRTMWPPPPTEDEAMCLSRCKRLWPQDQDSGGFFLALIRKTK